MVEAARTSNTSVYSKETIRRYIPEASRFQKFQVFLQFLTLHLLLVAKRSSCWLLHFTRDILFCIFPSTCNCLHNDALIRFYVSIFTFQEIHFILHMYDWLWNLVYNMKGVDVPFRTAADKIPSKRLMFISRSASLNIPQHFSRGFGKKAVPHVN
jgi:hypothetical protein